MNSSPETFQSLLRLAREARIDSDLLLECVRRRLIPQDAYARNDEAYELLCRVRRLTSLGVNVQGIEVIFHMRQQMLRMQQRQAELEAEIDRLREVHAREMAQLLNRFSDEAGTG